MANLNAATKAQGVGTKPTSAGAKVVVANKLPFPLRIRNFRMVTVTEQRPNSPSKDVQQAEALADNFVIHGTATLRGAGRASFQDGRRIMWGYSFTEGVDKESFDKWLHDNKDQPFILNKLVFAMPSMADAEAMAKENEKRVTNLEPINPDGDPRMTRGIETASRD